jgi:cell wall-associated NlpC family hydrolase
MMQYQHLVGRSFLYGVRDCYSMVVEFYRDNFGIELTNYARPSDWRSDMRDIIRDVYERDGFFMITDWKPKDLRPGDILACAVGESSPNHLVIYVGDNTVVHHLWGQLSRDDPFRDFFRNTTCFVLRHPDVPDLRPVLPETDIRSLLRDRFKLQAS